MRILADLWSVLKITCKSALRYGQVLLIRVQVTLTFSVLNAVFRTEKILETSKLQEKGSKIFSFDLCLAKS